MLEHWNPDNNPRLVLHNDDINTFEHVINTLVTACEHTYEQAEQCALLTHFKGSCEIKYGNLPKLKYMQNSLQKKGLKADIKSSNE